jgi:hypothetical protein
METQSNGKRRGGSLVIPLLVIVLGVLLLLDNLNVVSIDWSSIWKLWPVLLIAIGIEIILGRRVSFGAILLLVIVVLFGGMALSWSVLGGTGDRTTERITWPMDGVERAELVLDVGIAGLALNGQTDMSDLLVADLDLAPGFDVSDQVKVSGDVARGRIASQADFAPPPQIFGRKTSEWEVQLNEQVRWTLDVSSGVGDVHLDLSELRAGALKLDTGIGSVDVIMPQQGAVRATIDGGIGDITVAIPPGAQARVRVDQGIGDLNMGRRFEQQGDYFETEGLSSAESFILLEIDIGVGRITVR